MGLKGGGESKYDQNTLSEILKVFIIKRNI